MFRAYGDSNSNTFIMYLNELQKKFGKIAIILDRASWHKSKEVGEQLYHNKNVLPIYLPKGSPQLNAIEECRNIGKRRLLVSEYYATFETYRKVSEYYGTVRFNLNLYSYLYRTVLN